MPLLITISSAGPSSWEEVTKWRTGRLQHHLPHWKHWKPDNSQISGKACKLSKKSHLIAQCFSSTDDNGKASKVWGDHSRHWGQLWWPRAVHSDGNSAQLQRAQKRGARKEKGGAPAGTAHHQLDTGQFQNHPAYPDCLHCLATTVINICPIFVTIRVYPRFCRSQKKSQKLQKQIQSQRLQKSSRDSFSPSPTPPFQSSPVPVPHRPNSKPRPRFPKQSLTFVDNGLVAVLGSDRYAST